MTKITYSTKFTEHYKTRVKRYTRVRILFEQAFDMFISDPTQQSLRVHKLRGTMTGLMAFSIDEDYRVVFLPIKDGYLFWDVGKHAEVYSD